MRKTVITSKLTYSTVGYWLDGQHKLKIRIGFLIKNFQHTTCVEFEVHIRFGVKVVLHANVYEYGHLWIYWYHSLIFNAFILWSLKIIFFYLNWFQIVFLGFQPRIQLLTMSLLLENPTPICAALWQWEVGIFCPPKVQLKLHCLVF